MGARFFMVAMPIFVLYLQDNGLSIKEVFFLQVFFTISMLLFEVPSGYFADRFGRKLSLILGLIFGLVAYTVYYFAYGIHTLLLAEFIVAISGAFLSGANSALLYDTLQEEKQQHSYMKYEGRMYSFIMSSEAIAAVLSGVLVAVLTFRELFLVQAFVILLAIPIALTLKEPKVYKTSKPKSISQIVKFIAHENKKLLYLNIFGGILGASTWVMVFFAQPVWKGVEMPLMYFGFVWAGANLLVAASSYFAHKLDSYFSFRTLFATLAFVPIALYTVLALAVSNSASLSYFVIVGITMLFWLFRGAYNPIIKDYINRETSSDIRATVLSVQSLFNSLIFSALSPFLGWVADLWSFSTAFYVSALTFGVPSIIFFLLLHKRMDAQREDATI